MIMAVVAVVATIRVDAGSPVLAFPSFLDAVCGSFYVSTSWASPPSTLSNAEEMRTRHLNRVGKSTHHD